MVPRKGNSKIRRIRGIRVILIQPALSEDRYKTFFQHHDSLALGYLGAALDRAGISHRILDLQQFPEQEHRLYQELQSGNYDVIGFSAHSQKGFRDVHRILLEMKRSRTKGNIVLGGYFATLAAREIMESATDVDYIIKGEGEGSLIKLVKALERKQHLDEIPGISYRRPDGRLVNRRPSRVSEIDALPFPERPYLPAIRDEIRARSRYLGIITSRGCHQRCTFCSVSAFYFRTPKVRRSPDNVVEEIDDLYHGWAARKFKFYDESFLENTPEDREWMDRFCDRLIRDYPGLEYFAQFRSDAGDPALIEKMVRSGMTEAYIGVESGVQKHLDGWAKRSTRLQNERCLSLLKDLGVKVYLGFIMLAPTSTLKDVRSNFEWLKRTGCYRRDNLINRLNVYRGTPLYRQLGDRGQLIDSDLADAKNYRYQDALVARLAADLDSLKDIFRSILLDLDVIENAVYALRSRPGADPAQVRDGERRLAWVRQKELETWTALVDLAIRLAEGGAKPAELEAAARRAAREMAGRCRRASSGLRLNGLTGGSGLDFS